MRKIDVIPNLNLNLFVTVIINLPMTVALVGLPGYPLEDIAHTAHSAHKAHTLVSRIT